MDVVNDNQIGRLLPKCHYSWVVDRLFGYVQSELAESEACRTSNRIAADRKIVEECAVFALGTVVCLANDGGRIGIGTVDKMRKAMVTGGRITRCANPEA